MGMIDPVLQELDHEAKVTRAVLEGVPEDRFDWQPHEKSMSLVRLASHIAETPGWVESIVNQDELEMDMEAYVPYEASSKDELLETYDRNIASVMENLKAQADDHLMAVWRMTSGGQVLVEMPRIGVIRSFLLSHTYHHRGQLTVYLRLLDVPVPSVYGPSADDPGGS
ncbi:MAG: DUF664 domain-containing protein [bacterium]|nr:DUF664 domain-containing protein [bacterium]